MVRSRLCSDEDRFKQWSVRITKFPNYHTLQIEMTFYD